MEDESGCGCRQLLCCLSSESPHEGKIQNLFQLQIHLKIRQEESLLQHLSVDSCFMCFSLFVLVYFFENQPAERLNFLLFLFKK